MRFVVDADVLIGALDGSDRHHRRARKLLTRWHQQGDSVVVSVINFSEVLVAPAGDRELLTAARSAIVALGITVHSPSEPIGVDAARLRARYPISLPDAYLLATARHLRAAAASFDQKVIRAAQAETIPIAPQR